MAKKTQTIVTIIDDLDGSEITEDTAQEVFFGYKGTQYRLDLSKANADKLDKLINPYVAAAQKVSGGRGRPRGSGSTRPNTGSGRSKEEMQAVRDWAAKNGHEVSARGRIKQDVYDAFDEAHKAS